MGLPWARVLVHAGRAGQARPHVEQRSVAQFIGVCSSAKPCEMDENLLSMSDPISRLQERLIHAGAFIHPPPLQRRPVSRLYPYLTMERSSTPVSPVPEPGRRSVGPVPLPARVQTLLVQRLQAHLQRSHQHLAPSKPAVSAALDSRDVSALPRLLLAAYRQRGGGAYPDQLSVVLVAAQCGLVL